jgi:hypothetical protein
VDGSAENVIHGVAPYWRVAVQHRLGSQQVMVGSYGLVAHLTPTGFEGPRDRYSDVAFDAQLDRPLERGGSVTAHWTWIHEDRRLRATVLNGGADHVSSTLQTVRADATWYSARRLGATLGYFRTWGDPDPVLYPQEPVTGSARGRPDSSGLVAQLSFMPWLNARLALQYVAYARFNGASGDYDGAGRDAADNNALYLMTWLAF